LKRFIADTIEAVVSERIISEEIESGGEVYISKEDIQKMAED
jgi:ATP-dependent Clp protease ATP-binding subunit ClpA